MNSFQKFYHDLQKFRWIVLINNSIWCKKLNVKSCGYVCWRKPLWRTLSAKMFVQLSTFSFFVRYVFWELNDCSLHMCYILHLRLHMIPIIYKSASWWWRTSINMPGCHVDLPPLAMLWLENTKISMLSFKYSSPFSELSTF